MIDWFKIITGMTELGQVWQFWLACGVALLGRWAIHRLTR